MHKVATLELRVCVVDNKVTVYYWPVTSTVRCRAIDDSVHLLIRHSSKAVQHIRAVGTAHCSGDVRNDWRPGLRRWVRVQAKRSAGLCDSVCEKLVVTTIVCQQLGANRGPALTPVSLFHQARHSAHITELSPWIVTRLGSPPNAAMFS
jgi:hypothetical protein